MERENSSIEEVKNQEHRVMRHLRKAANGRRKRRGGRRVNGAAPAYRRSLTGLSQ